MAEAFLECARQHRVPTPGRVGQCMTGSHSTKYPVIQTGCTGDQNFLRLKMQGSVLFKASEGAHLRPSIGPGKQQLWRDQLRTLAVERADVSAGQREAQEASTRKHGKNLLMGKRPAVSRLTGSRQWKQQHCSRTHSRLCPPSCSTELEAQSCLLHSDVTAWTLVSHVLGHRPDLRT